MTKRERIRAQGPDDRAGGDGDADRRDASRPPVRSRRHAGFERASAARTTAVVAVTTVLLAWPPSAAAQQGAPAPADRPAAEPADVESVDAIVAALYDVISGAKGEERDWDRLRSLMYPGAVFLPNYPEQDEGPRPMSVEEFVEWAEQAVQEQGFYESEVDRTVQRYGPVANVFSTYESRRAPDEEPFVRGINSIQLVHDGERWWVAHIAWTDVREAGPIPERYGGAGG